MRIRLFIALVLMTGSAHAATLCAPDEQALWQCPIAKNHKMASLCASKDVSATQGYVQYRYGTPGKVELTYPATRAPAPQSFHYDAGFNGDGEYVSVQFTNAGNDYSLFNQDGSDNDRTGTASISVKTANGKTGDLDCRYDANNRLTSMEDIVGGTYTEKGSAVDHTITDYAPGKKVKKVTTMEGQPDGTVKTSITYPNGKTETHTEKLP